MDIDGNTHMSNTRLFAAILLTLVSLHVSQIHASERQNTRDLFQKRPPGTSCRMLGRSMKGFRVKGTQALYRRLLHRAGKLSIMGKKGIK